MQFVSRGEWGGYPPDQALYRTPVNRTYVHHTDTEPCDSLESCTDIVRNMLGDHTRNSEYYYVPTIMYIIITLEGTTNTNRL